MNMYKRVIVPTDGSELSLIGLKEGLEAAKAFDIPAVAIYVIPVYTLNGMSAHRYEDINKETVDLLRDHRRKEGKKVLEKVEEIADKMNVKLDTKIKEGEPYEEITGIAKENDLIYMCSHGRSGISSLFIGSTTDRVIKHTESTVAVVNASKGK